MIHYDLRCADGHEFDGWFRSSASFDDQAGSGLLACPACASPAVRRALMAPSLPRGAAPPPDRAAPAPATPTPQSTGVQPSGAPPALPDQARAALQRLRADIESRCDYVGPHFAREARRLAEAGTESRPIYGEATRDEAAALAEDGIAVSAIPWIARAES